MNRITVTPSGPDRRVPVENLPGTYFEQGAARDVYRTPYIAKCILDGDLIEVETDSNGNAVLGTDGTPVAKAKPVAETKATPASGAAVATQAGAAIVPAGATPAAPDTATPATVTKGS